MFGAKYMEFHFIFSLQYTGKTTFLQKFLKFSAKKSSFLKNFAIPGLAFTLTGAYLHVTAGIQLICADNIVTNPHWDTSGLL